MVLQTKDNKKIQFKDLVEKYVETVETEGTTCIWNKKQMDSIDFPWYVCEKKNNFDVFHQRGILL